MHRRVRHDALEFSPANFLIAVEVGGTEGGQDGRQRKMR
jgi:hypothetical protein